MNDTKEVYCLLVSKFNTSVTQQAVINHIVNNTGLDANLFKLTEMKSNNESEGSKIYVSYKVTTLQEGVYNAIRDESLWAPDFTVRDFYNERNFGRSKPYQNKKPTFQWNKDFYYGNRGLGGFDQRKSTVPPRFRKSENVRRNGQPRINQKYEQNYDLRMNRNAMNRNVQTTPKPRTPRFLPRRLNEARANETPEQRDTRQQNQQNFQRQFQQNQTPMQPRASQSYMRNQPMQR